MYPNFNSYNPSFNQFNAQMAQQQLAQQRLMQMQPQSELQFVNGLESAQMYQMPPNSKQILMDSNRARFYLKETDASGMARVTAYDFAEAKDEQPQQKDYVTRAEFDDLRSKYESIAEKLSAKPEQLSGFGIDDAGNDSRQS